MRDIGLLPLALGFTGFLFTMVLAGYLSNRAQFGLLYILAGWMLGLAVVGLAPFAVVRGVVALIEHFDA